mmetsp:Transcript_20068/g.47864  ORF Transcript_20068/g.47864 Transcript_20068/m.47864 type:complete len:710 (-) Transcript_20068:17-2146(-)
MVQFSTFLLRSVVLRIALLCAGILFTCISVHYVVGIHSRDSVAKQLNARCKNPTAQSLSTPLVHVEASGMNNSHILVNSEHPNRVRQAALNHTRVSQMQQNPLRISLHYTGPFYGPYSHLQWIKEANQCSFASNRSECVFGSDSESAPDAVVVLAGRPDRGGLSLMKLRNLPAHRRPKSFATLIHEKDHFFRDPTKALQRSWDFKVSYHISPDDIPTIPLGKNCRYFAAIMQRSLDLGQTFSRKGGVAGFISNCGPAFRRAYVQELMRYLRVDQFGKCHRNMQVPKSMERSGNWMATKQEALMDYQFGLAFENDVQDDYVTEKIFNVLAAGAVPIYFGTKDVHSHVPRGSFIDVRDFPKPMDLAMHVRSLQANRSKFNDYLQWGSAHWKRLHQQHNCSRQWFCRVCDFLLSNRTRTSTLEKREPLAEFSRKMGSTLVVRDDSVVGHTALDSNSPLIKTALGCTQSMIVVTAASQNHLSALNNFLMSFNRTAWLQGQPVCLLVYSLGLSLHTMLRLQGIHPWVFGFRQFEFARYPKHVQMDQDGHGAYAWKPIIIKEVADEFSASSVLWLDSGNQLAPHSLDRVHRRLQCDGIFVVGIQGATWHSIRKFVRQGTLDFLIADKTRQKALMERQLLLASKVGFRASNITALNLLSSWAACALIKSCIAPPTVRGTRHRWDQAVLSVLLHSQKLGHLLWHRGGDEGIKGHIFG